MITKEPSKYTVEDIAMIALYKFKLQALRKKREKYKVLLQAEIAEIKGQVYYICIFKIEKISKLIIIFKC